VRVRTYIHAAPGGEIDRPEMIEEHERADVPAQLERQQAAHDEAVSEIVESRLDDEFGLLWHAMPSIGVCAPPSCHRVAAGKT
jgi:hypothetical protein